MYIHPTWIEGLLQCSLIFGLPVIISIIALAIGFIKNNDKLIVIGMALMIISSVFIMFGSEYVICELYEKPSITETTITVQEWQPRVGISTTDGIMSITSANDLMLVDTNGNCYYNTENFWLGKFDTRDIFNQLKVNGTYRIKYYGWREGFNNGFPNILSVEQVIDENNTHTPKYSDYFGTKIIQS